MSTVVPLIILPSGWVSPSMDKMDENPMARSSSGMHMVLILSDDLHEREVPIELVKNCQFSPCWGGIQ